jgi:hypothetical protein
MGVRIADKFRVNCTAIEANVQTRDSDTDLSSAFIQRGLADYDSAVFELAAE